MSQQDRLICCSYRRYPCYCCLLHAKLVPPVRLAGVLNTDPLHTAGGVSVLVRVGIGLTTTATSNVVGLVQLLAVSV